ncbi:unnamed protein product [Choristocarpus tenellus]
MCLFIKDDEKELMKDLLEEQQVVGLSKIIKLQKLRTSYKQFKDRRELMGQFDLFLCDDRIMPMLTKALGKTFMSAKKQPVPLHLNRRASLGNQIALARDNTHLCKSYGCCWALKLANTSMTEKQVFENVMAGVSGMVEHVPKKWENIQSIQIKSTNSIALPIYSSFGDLPTAKPPAASIKPGVGGTNNRTDGKKEEGKGVDGVPEKQKKVKRPRPLLHQQLKKVATQLKAEKTALENNDAGRGNSVADIAIASTVNAKAATAEEVSATPLPASAKVKKYKIKSLPTLSHSVSLGKMADSEGEGGKKVGAAKSKSSEKRVRKRKAEQPASEEDSGVVEKRIASKKKKGGTGRKQAMRKKVTQI